MAGRSQLLRAIQRFGLVRHKAGHRQLPVQACGNTFSGEPSGSHRKGSPSLLLYRDILFEADVTDGITRIAQRHAGLISRKPATTQKKTGFALEFRGRDYTSSL
jgi:hypothetical protein